MCTGVLREYVRCWWQATHTLHMCTGDLREYMRCWWHRWWATHACAQGFSWVARGSNHTCTHMGHTGCDQGSAHMNPEMQPYPWLSNYSGYSGWNILESHRSGRVEDSWSRGSLGKFIKPLIHWQTFSINPVATAFLTHRAARDNAAEAGSHDTGLFHSILFLSVARENNKEDKNTLSWTNINWNDSKNIPFQ